MECISSMAKNKRDESNPGATGLDVSWKLNVALSIFGLDGTCHTTYSYIVWQFGVLYRLCPLWYSTPLEEA